MRRRSQILALCLLVTSSVSQGAFKFTAWADNRPSLGTTTQQNFHWVVLEMNRILGSEPLFHVVPGDYDYTSQTTAELQANALVKTWHWAPGNHDDNIGSSSNSSMDIENARLIFLNEYVCPAGICTCSLGRVCPHMLTWLESQLINAPPIRFVIGHEPAFPQNRHTTDSLNYYPEDRDAFWQLINQYGVHSYICGHTHYYSTYSDLTGPTEQIDLGNAGNPGEPEQTFAVFEVTESGVTWRAYRGLRNEPFDGGVQAYNPSPAEGALNVPITTSLSWTAGAGAVSHRLYLAGSLSELQQAAPLYTGSASSYDPQPDLSYGTSYWWRVDEVFSDGSVAEGSPWSFTTRELVTVRYAAAEMTINGSISGGLQSTESRENVYETLTEALNVANKNGYSTLNHIWRFDNVPPGANLQLRIEAHHTVSSDGDTFVLSYSADGSTYNSALALDKTFDDNSEQIQTLPASLHGTVWVKVEDTDHTRKNQLLDSVYVDCLYLVSSDETIPGVVVPDTSGNQPPVADAGADQTVVDTNGDGEIVTFNGSSSFDPDGQIVSYEWQFGETVLTGPNPSHTFGVGVHTGTLTVTDDSGLTSSDQVIITVQAAGGTMHVASLTGTANMRGSSRWVALATVKIVDQAGSPVAGATVSGAWSGADDTVVQGVTGTDGTVTLSSGSIKSGTSATFTVNDVTHGPLTYDPAANAISFITVDRPQ